jgi:hypothetical protein
MAFNISGFSSALKLGGARSSLFQVTLTNPVNPIADIQVPFMVKAASLPSSTMNVLQVPYFGRTIKLPGNRQVENWTVTILNDEDFLIRNALESWSNAINSQELNITSPTVASPALFKSTGQVTQFSKTGVPIRTYNFIGVWPVNIGPIDLNWEADQIQEYQVEFAVDWHSVDGITGTAGE